MTRAELERKLTPLLLVQIENNVWCSTCNEVRKIVDYEDHITINKHGDTILNGQCSICKGKVARYLETGETNHRA